MVDAQYNLNGSRDLTTPLSGKICQPWASTCYNQPTYQIWTLYIHPSTTKIWNAIRDHEQIPFGGNLSFMHLYTSISISTRHLKFIVSPSPKIIGDKV